MEPAPNAPAPAGRKQYLDHPREYVEHRAAFIRTSDRGRLFVRFGWATEQGSLLQGT
jgi:hypothetical protein